MIMEKHHIQRLREEQQKAVTETQEQIHTLDTFRKDYVSLQERLETLPDKVTHDVMVPFGKKAFMQGKLVHTNEILVLLGDNWFVERSAKQASQIVDRRLSVLDKQIAELDQQLNLLTPRLDFTSELQGLVEQSGEVQEINEEYDPEQEKKWRERHKESLRRYNRQQREEHRQLIEDEKRKEDERKEREINEAELFARLDQLEKEEEENCELESSDENESDEGESNGSEVSGESTDEEEDSQRKVKWKDDPGPIRKTASNVIRFTHSAPSNSTIAESSTSGEVINSPRDIYEKFATHAPKSILKQMPVSPLNTSGDNSMRGKVDAIIASTCQGARPKTMLPSPDTTAAFSEKVVEKTNQASHLDANSTQDSQEQPKKVSKFKARRMQSKS